MDTVRYIFKFIFKDMWVAAFILFTLALFAPWFFMRWVFKDESEFLRNTYAVLAMGVWFGFIAYLILMW